MNIYLDFHLFLPGSLLKKKIMIRIHKGEKILERDPWKMYIDPKLLYLGTNDSFWECYYWYQKYKIITLLKVGTVQRQLTGVESGTNR